MKKSSLWIKWLICIIPALVGLIMYFILPLFPKFTEFFITRGLFRVVAFPVEWVMSVFPFSITELVVVLSAPAITTLFIIWVIRIIRKENKLSVFEKGCRFVAWCVSLAILIFMVMDGANFSRIPTGELLELPNRRYTAEELYILTADLAEKASEARENLPESSEGTAKLTVKKYELLLKADDCYRELKKEYPFLKTATFRVKSVALSHLWSYTGTTGVYCPWLGEASINTDIPVYDLGHTATHEVAHTMGFAKENECNFLGWLACSVSGQPDYIYSGHLQAYIYCSNALYKADKELWRKATQKCSEGVIADLRNSSEYWKQFEGEVQESSQKVNDTFIKVNGVESGVLSYNEMVELMLRYYDKEGFFD